eukprot:CAMPEP_0174267076 /NCGR_PEP_ID=MMETSP0439-20130205/32373_1 /TAXON_ID=0 /ORGANISM="Stereomyxa ramosa, Strain Chinc5" /LENGTH=172 /DNA_ID=CAMNT_0015354385 /DNA_START=830 /DNA_END=1345 /DNA_ORIENTATION=+
MATVGYGEMVALSWWGRIFSTLSAAVGIILAAIFVAVLTQSSILSIHQLFALEWLDKMQVVHKEKEYAAILIQRRWRFYMWKKYNPVLNSKTLIKRQEDLNFGLIPIIVQLRKYRLKRKLGSSNTPDPIMNKIIHLEKELESTNELYADRILSITQKNQQIVQEMKKLANLV